MAPAVKKIADKLTDAEKKKVKQANKQKANPEQAEKKAAENLRRRIGRGQEVVKEETANVAKVPIEDQEVVVSKGHKAKPVKTDAEKQKRRQEKIDAINKKFANARGIVEHDVQEQDEGTVDHVEGTVDHVEEHVEGP